MVTADEIIEMLYLVPHPEGGYFREAFRDAPEGRRAHSTAIYYLLKEGESSHWHRVDAAEVWHWYAGDPLALRLAPGADGAYSGKRSGRRSAPSSCCAGALVAVGKEPRRLVARWLYRRARFRI